MSCRGFPVIQARVDQAFFHKAGRQAGGLAMTSHFRTTSHSRLFIYFKTCDEHVST